MAPALEAARALAQALKNTGKPLDIAVTATLEGLDIDLRGCGALKEKEARALVELAEALDLARLSNHGRVLALQTPADDCSGAGEALAAARRLLAGHCAGRRGDR